MLLFEIPSAKSVGKYTTVFLSDKSYFYFFEKKFPFAKISNFYTCFLPFLFVRIARLLTFAQT